MSDLDCKNNIGLMPCHLPCPAWCPPCPIYYWGSNVEVCLGVDVVSFHVLKSESYTQSMNHLYFLLRPSN